MTARAWRRELAVILDELDPGATIDSTRPGHIRITLTNGERVYASSSPSDWRTGRNTRRDILRALRSAQPAARRDLARSDVR